MSRNDIDKITLHVVVPRTLRRDLKVEAAKRGISLRALAITALRAALRQQPEQRNA